jgi:hypothetical protein
MSENRELGRKYSQKMQLEPPRTVFFINSAINFCNLLALMAQRNPILISTHSSLILVLNMNYPISNKLRYGLRG